jgi:hypothetical protein
MTLNISDVKLPVLGEDNFPRKIHLEYGGTKREIIETQIEPIRLSFLHRHSSDQNLFPRGNDWQSSEQNNRKLISLHNNGEDEKHAHGIDIFCNDKAICNIFIVFKHLQPSSNKFCLEICRIKIITIPLSRSRMFYIMLNVYIFNSFKEPLVINSMTYLV